MKCNNKTLTNQKMSESLTPWEYQPQHTERPLSPKRLPKQPPVFHRYNSEGARIRTRTSQKSRVVVRDVIKLQQRTPTQSAAQPDWQVQLKTMNFLKNQLIIKIPNQFVTIPPKRNIESQKKVSKSLSKKAEVGVVREKVSFRNFKRQIEELDRLRCSNLTKFGTVKQTSRASSRYSSVKTFKRCSLQNMNPFDAQPVFPPKTTLLRPKLPQPNPNITKKHILDHLLSKFQ